MSTFDKQNRTRIQCTPLSKKALASKPVEQSVTRTRKTRGFFVPEDFRNNAICGKIAVWLGVPRE